MKLTRDKLLRGLGAAVVAILMVFTGLAPAGAESDTDPYWCVDGGTTITWRKGPCGEKPPDLSLNARRYSKDTGEIMWERMSGAVGYEIIQDGKSLGVHDVLSWYMTGLQEESRYTFEVRAMDRDGNYMSVRGFASIQAFGSNLHGYY